MGKRNDAKKLILEQTEHLKKIVEIGCNNPSRRISEDIIGVDVFYKHKPNIVADIEFSLPFKNCSLEAIVGIDIVEHIDDIDKFLEECLRVLKDNGLMMFAIPRADIFGYEIKNIKRYGHKHMWTKDEWHEIVDSYPIKEIICKHLAGKWFFMFSGKKWQFS